ncbi:MAG: isoaspartyl peptidase/L-asparaginase [Nitrospiraceae bacterium]|nr:isoaspartyl peptidase/L-asparaginase [Nitrospiraceae bacterium]
MLSCGIVVHGGVGSPPGLYDGCQQACEVGFEILEKRGSALDAVVAAVKAMEDDGRFNAGRGSVLRLDGKTIEMDASVMDSGGGIGTVAAIRGVKNPVLVAKEVYRSPHAMLAGEGAIRFARAKGFSYYRRITEAARARHKKNTEALMSGKLPLWKGKRIEDFWNFQASIGRALNACDTVGAVALDSKGKFAVASSTGGASAMLLGRVGDTPMIGCGFYAGPEGAIASTGIGEEIIKRMLAKTVYDKAASGPGLEKACAEEISRFPKNIPVGVIAISRSGPAVAANRQMAWAKLII